MVFHDLRHTLATRLVLGGIDLVTVKELMGHADISTTMRYAHPSPDSKRHAVDCLSAKKVADMWQKRIPMSQVAAAGVTYQ